MSDECSDEYSDEEYYDDYDDEDSYGSFNDLPPIVKQELERRKNLTVSKGYLRINDEEKAKMQKEMNPASEDVMKALRDCVDEGLFKPEMYGGYFDIVEVR